MSIPALLHELGAAGIRLHPDGDSLRAEIPPGASLDPFRDRIRAAKPALLAEFRARSEFTAMGLDPFLLWVSVYMGPVEASKPPEGWDGQVPAGCAVPSVCAVLGCCPHHTAHGRCWKAEETQ